MATLQLKVTKFFAIITKRTGMSLLNVVDIQRLKLPKHMLPQDSSVADVISTSVPAQPGFSTLIPELVQQIIVNALSTFGILGRSKPSIWYLDSGASNHMTSSSNAHLSNLEKYAGNHRIQTVDGGKIPIMVIGDISSFVPLKNVYLCPSLTSNLLSIGATC